MVDDAFWGLTMSELIFYHGRLVLGGLAGLFSRRLSKSGLQRCLELRRLKFASLSWVVVTAVSAWRSVRRFRRLISLSLAFFSKVPLNCVFLDQIFFTASFTIEFVSETQIDELQANFILLIEQILLLRRGCSHRLRLNFWLWLLIVSHMLWELMTLNPKIRKVFLTHSNVWLFFFKVVDFATLPTNCLLNWIEYGSLLLPDRVPHAFIEWFMVRNLIVEYSLFILEVLFHLNERSLTTLLWHA